MLRRLRAREHSLSEIRTSPLRDNGHSAL
jgi:hypothetical protein